MAPPDQEINDSRQSLRQLAQVLGKLIALVLVVVLVILIERYCTSQVPPFGPGAKIVSVDGDSIRAANGADYRLFGIDAPELHQTCSEANGKSWLCGRAAKARLTALINRGKVNCEARATDRFGRVVAVCSAEGVPDLGEALVRDGDAIDLGALRAIPIAMRKPRLKPGNAASGAAPSSARRIGAKTNPREVD